MTVYEDHQTELKDQKQSRQTSTPMRTKGKSPKTTLKII